MLRCADVAAVRRRRRRRRRRQREATQHSNEGEWESLFAPSAAAGPKVTCKPGRKQRKQSCRLASRQHPGRTAGTEGRKETRKRRRRRHRLLRCSGSPYDADDDDDVVAPPARVGDETGLLLRRFVPVGSDAAAAAVARKCSPSCSTTRYGAPDHVDLTVSVCVCSFQ